MITRKSLSGNDQRLISRVKTADESITNDNTPSNDNTLFFTAKPNTIYLIYVRLDIDSDNPADFQYFMTIPSGANGKWLNTAEGWNSGSTGTLSRNITTSVFVNFASPVTDVQINQCGFIQTGATGGVIAVQWSQQVSDPSTATMQKGSSILVVEA